MDSLRSKLLVMIVGPTAVGKSTIMHTVAEMDERFGYVSSFVTRPPRKGEISTYRHITRQEARQLHDERRTVTYFEHPTTGVIYGTTADSYTHEYNLLDTLSGSVGLYRSIPFARSVTISLTADPDEWQVWLDSRFPVPSEERTKRLREALTSIEWSLSQQDDHAWVVNRPGESSIAARRIIGLAVDPRHESSAPPEATMLLERVKSLLSYEQTKE